MRIKAFGFVLVLSVLCVSLSYSGIIGVMGSGVTPPAGGCSGSYGYTTGASEADGGITGGIWAIRVPLGCDGTVGTINAYVKYVSGSDYEAEFALYDDDGSGTDPAAFIGNYGAGYGSQGPEWSSDTSVGEAIAGTPGYVWVAVMLENSGSQFFYNTSGTIPARIYDGTWGSWPDPWPTGSDTAYSNRDYSIYLTF